MSDLPRRVPADVFTERLPVVQPPVQTAVQPPVQTAVHPPVRAGWFDEPAAVGDVVADVRAAAAAPETLRAAVEQAPTISAAAASEWFRPAIEPAAPVGVAGWSATPDAGDLLDAVKVLTDHGRWHVAEWLADWAAGTQR